MDLILKRMYAGKNISEDHNRNIYSSELFHSSTKFSAKCLRAACQNRTFDIKNHSFTKAICSSLHGIVKQICETHFPIEDHPCHEECLAEHQSSARCTLDDIFALNFTVKTHINTVSLL